MIPFSSQVLDYPFTYVGKTRDPMVKDWFELRDKKEGAFNPHYHVATQIIGSINRPFTFFFPGSEMRTLIGRVVLRTGLPNVLDVTITTQRRNFHPERKSGNTAEITAVAPPSAERSN
ncbi:hypothetical protein CDAR_96711 [Caerostris darwini]|uniref:Uncharacterized protein n=1 Tax=Caerostris darwini TaxID=1538125 RepID=A0AAV4QW12_9ARAC|nr:hypothetical protein CDAR_96711 [Caerostris darwini]